MMKVLSTRHSVLPAVLALLGSWIYRAQYVSTWVICLLFKDMRNTKWV